MIFHKKTERLQYHDISKFSAQDFRNISIIPTYDDNSSRSSKLNQFWDKQFPQPLKWEGFCWVVERLLNTQGLETLYFIGGEPTLWNEIDKAIYFARKNKIKTHLTTNGIFHTQKSFPDRVFVNLHTYIDFPDLRKSIEQSISFYKGKTRLHLCLYIRNIEKIESITLVEDLAKRLKLELERYHGYSNQIFNCDNCLYSGVTIQPDGDTIKLCRFLPISTQLSKYLSLREAYEKDLLPKLQKQPRLAWSSV